MSDTRPDCVYAVLVREGRAFLRSMDGGLGLPGGEFRPLAADRKVELAAYLFEQLGIDAVAIWGQGAFDYRNPDEEAPRFSGFYSVWDFEGSVPDRAGVWLRQDQIAAAALDPSVKILLTSILNTRAIKTT